MGDNPYYGALDLGSNSFHLIIVQSTENNGIQEIDKVKHMVRLGEGLGKDNALSAEAMARGIAALEQMSQLLKPIPDSHFRAVGTNTLRIATNGAAFLQQAEKILGKPIEIISGTEEAALIYRGISKHNHFNDRMLVIDIGGGSTEVIIGENSEPEILRSLKMGCANIAKAYFPDGSISKSAIKKAIDHVGTILEPHIETYRRAPRWQRVVLSSGTAKAVEKVLKQLSEDQPLEISAADLEMLLEKLLAIGEADKLPKKLNVDEARAFGFTGGVCILLGLFRHLGIEKAVVSQEALREGVLLDLMGRIDGGIDERERTTLSMQQRFNVNLAQAAQVANLACHLNAQLPEKVPERFASLLRYGALLHECGRSIARQDAHKHSAYIVDNADMPGYSRLMQDIMAVLLRSQRRKFPLKEIARLPEIHQPWIWQNIIALRLAVLICRARTPIATIDFPDIRRLGITYRLRFPDGYLENHPLTVADLYEEQPLWLEFSLHTLEFNAPVEN